MRFILIDGGNDAHWPQLATSGVNGAYYPVNDPVDAVAQRLLDTRARGLYAGIFASWNWWPEASDGARFAEIVHARLTQIENATGFKSASFPKVQFDQEEHKPATILAMLRRWRQLRPKQDTSWTLEGMQGGWMSPEFVAEVSQLRIRVSPQCYRGEMANISLRDSNPGAFLDELIESVWDTRSVVDDLIKRGFAPTLISPYYDAAFLPQLWDGFAFTMGRLPT